MANPPHTSIPSAAEVRGLLNQLAHAGVKRLSSVSGTPFTTLWKIRNGKVTNPGIETVRGFHPYLALVNDVTKPDAPAT